MFWSAVNISGLRTAVDKKGGWRSIFNTRVKRYFSTYNVRGTITMMYILHLKYLNGNLTVRSEYIFPVN